MDKKITITFDSFEDFKRFLFQPGSVRLNQIAVEESGVSYREPPALKNGNGSRVGTLLTSTLVEHLQRARQLAADPVRAGVLIKEALNAVGQPANKRNVRNAVNTLGRLARSGAIHRFGRGVYALDKNVAPATKPVRRRRRRRATQAK